MWAWLLVGLGCHDGAVSEAPAPAPSAIVLVVDGVRTDEFCGTTPSDLTGVPGDAMAPDVWADLAPDAAWHRGLLNTGVTITAPAHAALLTGTPEPYANFPMRGDDGPALYRPLVPTLFEAARARLGLDAEDVVLVANTGLLEGLTRSATPGGEGATWDLVPDATDDDGWPSDDAGVLDEIRRLVDEGPPRLVVANLHDVDRAGHYGEDPEYPARIGMVDAEIAAFYQWLRDEHPAYAANLLLVVTADHGRHRGAAEDGWRNHGDACDGCREAPLFVVGPGFAPGEMPTAPHALDLAPTIAAHLGFPLPWAQGFPLGEGTVRSGEIAVAASGGLVATQVWRDAVDARSEVVVDGEVVSTPGARGAEAPTVLDGAIRAACWRELDDTGDARPWVPRCRADTGGGWADIGFAVAEVGPSTEIALVERDGRLWAAWPENAHGVAELMGGTVGLAVASWSPTEGWSAPVLTVSTFPTDAALVATADGLVAAWGTSLGDPDSRYTRRVRVQPFMIAEGVATAGAGVDLAREGARVEHPVLTTDGALRLAFVVIGRERVTVEATTSADGGRTWDTPVALPARGEPVLHVPPAWDGDAVVWATVDANDTLLCRARPGDADAACVSVGSPRVDSFAVTPGGATVVRDADVAAWERAEVAW